MLSTKVLIIGAGPAGLLSAISLAQAGIPCVLAERRLERLDAPKAHAVNPRTLEICARHGVSADEIRAAGASAAEGGKVHFMDTLTGPCFGHLPYERQDAGALEFTPWPLVNVAQPVFEQFLSLRLNQCPGVSLLRGVTATSLKQTPDSVIATLSGAGFDAPVTLRADYVIAADGAASPTREQLGIGMAGPEALQSYMMIHFEADLSQLTEAHPGLLYFTLSPEAQGVFIGYERRRTWVFMQSYDPNTQFRSDFDDTRCRSLIEAAAGTTIDDLAIRNVSPWTMSAQVADAYRQGRVFLVGDAAHRFPPTGGLGLNTGIADAENIGWKLARVLNGQASATLLDSYEAERRPVAQINSHQSLTNSAKLLHLFAALHGPDPTRIHEHYRKVCADPGAHPDLAAAVEVQRPHFDSFNLQIGYRYGTCPQPESIDISTYVPSFEVGDYLPRIELRDSPWLLGLLPSTGFTLVTGPDGRCWSHESVTILTEGTDFQPTAGFASCAGLTDTGALLVRPDGHICGRWTHAPADPQSEIATCLDNSAFSHSTEN